MTIVRVAAVQAEPVLLDLPRSLERLEAWTRRAAADGATIIAFPETWLPGYPAWLDVSPAAAQWDHPGAKAVFQRLWANAVEVPGPVTRQLGDLARSLGVTLVVGVHERAGRSLFNAIITVGEQGTLLNHHRKLVPTHGERLVWGAGDGAGLRVVRAGHAKLGSLVCWEHWMPLARQVMHDAGEEIHVAQWPGVKEMHLVASRHYAFEGRCFVIAAGAVLRAAQLPPELPAPGAPELLLAGGSAIIAPDGRCLAGPAGSGEALLVADCDLDEIARESMTLDVSGHYARPDVFYYGMREGAAKRQRRDD